MCQFVVVPWSPFVYGKTVRQDCVARLCGKTASIGFAIPRVGNIEIAAMWLHRHVNTFIHTTML